MYFRDSSANPVPYGFSIEQYVGGFQYKFIPNAVFSGFVLRAREKSKNNRLNIAFKKYCFRSEIARIQIRSTSSYTTRALTNGKLLSQILLPYPKDPDEQKAIADALSDVDALIGSLEKLIAKKRDIKTATMQQLLTGKKRLPGFQGHWVNSQLGEIGLFRKGKGIRKDDVLDSGLPCVRYGEIYTRHHDYIKKFYSFISPAVASEATSINSGDLLFAGSGETSEEIGKCVAYLSDEQAFAGGDIVIYRAPSQDAKYLGFLMNHESVVVQKMQMGQGDAVVHIHAKNLAGIEVCLPSIDEQKAISGLLSDMDFEIGELEKRLTKTNSIIPEITTGLCSDKKAFMLMNATKVDLLVVTGACISILPMNFQTQFRSLTP